MIALGTNTLPGLPDKSYKAMLDAIHASKRSCDWIAPPHLQPEKARAVARVRKEAAFANIEVREKGLDRFYSSLQPMLGSTCAMIDARKASESGVGHETNEGIHPTAAAAKARFEAMRARLLAVTSGSRHEAAELTRTQSPGHAAK